MPKRKNPATSLEAFNNLDPIRLSQMQQDIVRAVKALGEANYEAIADFLMVKPEKVWKRLNECVKANMIYRPGTTVKTKNGAKSYVFRVVEGIIPIQKVTESFPKGKGSTDFAKQIIQNTLF